MKRGRGTVIRVLIFGLAMGYLEAAVVVYLREIYYPAGFFFPLKPIAPRDALVEVLREAATLAMLLAVGGLAGKSARERFGLFLGAFGIWDMTYYLSLKLILGWPPTWTTPDILFLIPVPWVGPVWAPLVLSATMILAAAAFLEPEGVRQEAVSGRAGLWCLVLGALGVIASFTKGPLSHLSGTGLSPAYVPGRFPAGLFWASEALILVGIGLFRGRTGRFSRPRGKGD